MDGSGDATRNRPTRMSAAQARQLFENLATDSESDSSESISSSVPDDTDRSSDSEAEEVLFNDDSHSDSDGSADRGASPQPGPSRGKRRRVKTKRPTRAAAPETEWREILHTGGTSTQGNFAFLPKGRRTPGVNGNLNLDNTSTPFDCFKALFSDEVTDFLVTSINAYAAMKCQMNNPAKKRSVFGKWELTNRHEVLKFFTVVIAMGIDKRPTVKHYWSGHEMFQTTYYQTLFTRDRFEALYHTFLHCSAPGSENKEKIEPFLNLLLSKFNEAFYPFQDLSLDEMVIGFTGRWQYKQYNASKPRKYHIKTFGLVDSTTGYVVNLLTYFGRNTSYDPSTDEDSGMAVKVFETLLQPCGTGHHVYADRYYTTHQLIEALFDQETYYTGTVNVNRKNFPKEVKTAKLGHLETKTFMDKENKILTTMWKDKKAKKPVVIASSKASATMLTVPSGKTTKTVPDTIHKYNYAMNGCDRVDQNVSYYGNYNSKTYKWWKRIFHWLLEVVQTNAYVLYLMTRAEGTKRPAMLDFKFLLMEQLTSAAAQIMPREEQLKPQQKRGRPSINAVARLQGAIHIVKWVGKDRNCVHCSRPEKRVRSSYVCRGCPGEPHLCPKLCFEAHHSA